MLLEVPHLQGLNEAVLILAAQLAQDHNHFDLGDVLVAEAVIGQR